MKPVTLRETESWMIIGKPPHWHTLRGDREPNIEDWLLRTYPELSHIREAGLVHRLDEGTSGCLLVTKNEDAYAELSHSFKVPGLVQKTYLCVVKGVPKQNMFELYFSSRYKRSQKASVELKGRVRDRGQCRFQVLKTFGEESLLSVELIGPGKRHQIRAGLAFLGHPIRGDALYGSSVSSKELHLHAWKLKLDGLETECPLFTPWEPQQILQLKYL